MPARSKEGNLMTVPGLERSTLSVVDVRRLANDSIRELMERLDTNDVPAEFLCECGDLRCDLKAAMTLAEYDETPGGVRAH
jgi:hypothetical protein